MRPCNASERPILRFVESTVWVLVLFSLCGCRGREHAAPEGTAPIDPWILVDRNAIAGPALLWNGLIGVRIKPDYEAGDPAPLFDIGEYESSGEERIRTFPNPLASQVLVASNRMVAAAGTNFLRRLDMRTGILTTTWHQSYTGGGATVRCETVLHPSRRVLGERWTVIPDRADSTTIEYRPALFGCAGLPAYGHFESLSANLSYQGRSAVLQVAAVPPAQWSIEGGTLRGRVELADAESGTFEQVLSLETPPSRLGPAAPISFDELADASKRAWSVRWQTDIEVDGPVEDQQAVRSFLFYLRSAVLPREGMAVAPFALSNTRYNGHVFWDADIWVFPALAFIDPQTAASIVAYRTNVAQAARFFARGKKGFGYRFPWESSVSGKEVAPEPLRPQIHISGDVAWSLNQAAALGLASPPVAAKIIAGVSTFYLTRASRGDSLLELRDVIGPDENRVVDNDLYTNLLAQWCVNGGRWNAPLARSSGAIFKLPRDATSFIAYDKDPVDVYKQPAAELAIYPLQFPAAEQEATVIMERIAPKVKTISPAMTDSLHALIWARLGKPERAYELWQRSWKDFLTPPLLQFSEKRSGQDTYFVTGAAECLQTLIYGFLGFRIDFKEQEGALWSTGLKLGKVLSVRPNLPKAWRSVKFRNFVVMGRRYTLIASHAGLQLFQGDH